MKTRTVAAAIALAVSCLVPLPAATSLMPVSEIKTGMVGIGRTVFEGSELQEFQAHILGVLHNVQGPHRDLILARLEGGPLAKTGVAAGMSGSPVFIDGRLIGAVSYSVGAFATEAIAGITPIEEMKDATEMARRIPTQQARIELPITREGLAAALSATYARIAPFANRPADIQVFGLSQAAGTQLGAMLRPISTPLVMNGFEPESAAMLAGAFGAAGFTPVVGGAIGGQGGANVKAMTGPLREGDAVGVSLVGGDLEMGATGTITHIDGNRVYAFGHPFFNVGPSQFPLTRAYVHAMLPSLMSSFKISSMGEIIGTMQQDRATAIAGTLGKGPTLIPMSVTLQSTRDDGSTSKRSFTFDVANDQVFTPLLTYVALANTLTAYERQFGAATFTVKSRAQIKDHGDLTLDDVFTGDNAVLGASTAIAGPITMLLSNDREPITVSGLNISIDASETSRTATIERVWLDELRPRAGRTVPLKVLTRNYRGEDKISTVPIEIPANVSGTVSLLVTDGRQLNAMEQRDLRRSLQPQSVAQMIRVLNDTRRNNRIYIRLLNGKPGAIVNGEALTSLPPSVLSVLESDSNGGSYTPIRSAAVGEWELSMDSAVSGSRVLSIDVEGGAGGR
ncbi:MAG: SpoIVB peptidase S55 domain-containing protein [Vicinamibacterales bacterium]